MLLFLLFIFFFQNNFIINLILLIPWIFISSVSIDYFYGSYGFLRNQTTLVSCIVWVFEVESRGRINCIPENPQKSDFDQIQNKLSIIIYSNTLYVENQNLAHPVYPLVLAVITPVDVHDYGETSKCKVS